MESLPAVLLETSTNVTNQNINLLIEEAEVGQNELNVTLKEVSNLLERCWKNEASKQSKERNDQQQEIGTLKEILSVYQNLSKLVQLQSNTLKTTIIDFENLCNENEDLSGGNRKSNAAQVQLLSSADHISKCAHYQNEESVTAKSANSGSRKKRRKSKKSSKKNQNGCKTS